MAILRRGASCGISTRYQHHLWALLWQLAKEGCAKQTSAKCQSGRTCSAELGPPFLLAPPQSRNSQEPAAWHALGCAASPSCHLLRVKPSAGCRNLCPLCFILGGNLSWGHWVGHWGSVTLIMYVCLMSACVQLSHQLPTHLECDFKLEEIWSIAAAAGKCVCKS